MQENHMFQNMFVEKFLGYDHRIKLDKISRHDLFVLGRVFLFLSFSFLFIFFIFGSTDIILESEIGANPKMKSNIGYRPIIQYWTNTCFGSHRCRV